MAFTTAPFPADDPLVDRKTLTATQVFIDWVTALTTDVDASAARLTSVTAETQSASIATTPFALGALASGLYRVTYFARITQAATTSSSLTPTVSFTHGGVSCSFSGTAMTGNTTSTVGTGSFLLSIDASSPVSYSTTYASVGGTVMKYLITFVVEQVEA